MIPRDYFLSIPHKTVSTIKSAVNSTFMFRCEHVFEFEEFDCEYVGKVIESKTLIRYDDISSHLIKVSKFSPRYLHDLFNFSVSLTGCSNWNKYRLFIADVRTNMGKYALYCHGLNIWNSLDYI